jgi:UDP:flavonoid glycosyltransferase YjiC (YdhE family)
MCSPNVELMFKPETIFTALATSPTPIRALVSAGWGGLGGTDVPENVFVLGNVPHDWLFEKVSLSLLLLGGRFFSL